MLTATCKRTFATAAHPDCARARMASVFLVLCLLTFFGCAGRKPIQSPQGRVLAEPGGFNQYSVEDEIAIGRQAAAEVDRRLPVLESSHPISRYVQQLGERMIVHAPGHEYPYTFRVVNQKEINAFALPGGPIYFNAGLIQAADEAELAGVMGHEISHVAMRHSTRQASKQMLAQLPIAILGGVLGQGATSQLAQLGISFAAGSVFLKYSRDAETEADIVGSQIMYDSGFDPQAMVSFFSKLEQKAGSDRGPQFLNSHPNPGNRAQNVANVVAKFPAKEFSRHDSAAFTETKKLVAELKPGAASGSESGKRVPEFRGLSRETIVPSKNFRTLRHRAFTIEYPENWQVTGEFGPAVTIHPAGAVADNVTAYGVIVSSFRPDGKQVSLESATRELIEDLRGTNPELVPSAEPQASTVNQRRARFVEMAGPSPLPAENGRPQSERVRLVVIQGQGGEFSYLAFISTAQDQNLLQPAFERMLRSFVPR